MGKNTGLAKRARARRTKQINRLCSGKGVLTFPDGSTYEGEWKNGFMNGEGTFTWSDGKQKSGIWENGKLLE